MDSEMSLRSNEVGHTDKEECTDSSLKLYRRLNLNRYATKKSAAQSMLDISLLMANSSQLKSVLYVGPQYRFYSHLIFLLSLSITLQITVGVLLMFIVKYDLNDVRKHAKLNNMNNAATLFVFFTVIINIFITVLGTSTERHELGSPVTVMPLPEPYTFHMTVEQTVDWSQ